MPKLSFCVKSSKILTTLETSHNNENLIQGQIPRLVNKHKSFLYENFTAHKKAEKVGVQKHL